MNMLFLKAMLLTLMKAVVNKRVFFFLAEVYAHRTDNKYGADAVTLLKALSDGDVTKAEEAFKDVIKRLSDKQ